MEQLQMHINQHLGSFSSTTQKQLDSFNNQLLKLTQINEGKLEFIRSNVDEKLKQIHESNSTKLEQMRQTVEEKLQSTLERRLGESFKIVSERLEKLHKGFGEMQNLAAGVGDLKKVLSNIKVRGIWGEVQLNGILSQLMTMDQYKANVKIPENSQNNVEYAIKIPDNQNSGFFTWLPIDSKFPLADYQRLIEAQENGDLEQVNIKNKALITSIKNSAKAIADKYIKPPFTTDFGIMFFAY